MTPLAGRYRFAAALLVLIVLTSGGPLDAAPAKPEYLPYAEFTTADTPPQITVKQAYNEAVLRYNQALYDYHVLLEKHDQLVELYNGSSNPSERQKARDEATPLRAQLAAQRREVTNRAAAVDQAARRAGAAGVSITR